MEYERKYQNRINWQNTPSMSTPLNATNLNKMDVALQYMDGKLAEASGDIVSIEANPSGTATGNLTKLKVDNTIYNVGSYTAGSGINIVNGAIQNTEAGARSGIIDSISSSRAHTQITLATNETFKPYETLILKSETSGSASTLRVQYASSASFVYDYNLYDTDGTTAKTLSLESGKIIIVMLDQTGYKAIVLSDGISGGGGLPENPLSTAHGGTGNTVGYITTGALSDSEKGDYVTIAGRNNTVSGNYSSAEGYSNTVTSMYAHAEGYGNSIGSDRSHAEGRGHTISGTGNDKHAEGYYNTVTGNTAHAEGSNNTASGVRSHVGGSYNVAGYSDQTVIGTCNNNKSTTLFEVGNGTATDNRNNAFEVYNDGKISCDNGSSKFQFTQSSGVDGYKDAGGTFHAFGGGSSTVSKTTYLVDYSSWSSTPDSDGFYTSTFTVSPSLDTSVPPNIYISGGGLHFQPNDGELNRYKNIKRARLNSNMLMTLYATSKPGGNFTIYVEGVLGSGSSDTMVNVIQPNGATLPILTDTNISSPSNGQVLTYNSTSSKWENQSIPDNSYALVGMGQVTSYSNKLANTNVYLHRAPKEGDRLFIHFPTEITDSDAQIKIYDEASGTAYTLSFSFWASGWKLYGLCLLGIADDGLGNLGLSLIYNFEGGTNYTAGAGIEINGSAISNTAPNYGVDVDGATISSVSSGNLGTYVGESKYLILYFSASASPYSGGYTLTLSYSSGAVAIQEYGTLYDGSSRFNSNISAGTMLLCEVTDTGAGSLADPVHVNIIGKIDPNSSGGGNTVSKTRYQISSSSWSSSANSDGYYTATVSLNPSIGSSPDIYVAGSADGTQPTSTEEGQFAYVKRCKVNGSTLTLYATSKPSSTFYIWVEGVNGTGSGDIVGNIIKPNGESSGGSSVQELGSMTFNKSDFIVDGSNYYKDGMFTATESNTMKNADLICVYAYVKSTSDKDVLLGSETFSLKTISNTTRQMTIAHWGASNPYLATDNLRVLFFQYEAGANGRLVVQFIIKSDVFSSFASGSVFGLKVVKIA